MRGFSRTVQLALAIISTFASDITLASTPEEMATAYFQAIGGRDTQSLPEPIKSRTIRQIKKLSDPRVSELAPGILSNFTSSITNIFTKQELWDEYQKFVEIAKSLPEPINGETVLALARFWYPKSISESVRHSFGKKLMSNQKNQINFLQKLARCNNISIFKIRKDKKGYTKTPLTIPQLKSRLTRNGISYKINKSKFGMDIFQTRRPGAVLSGAGMETLDRLRSNRTHAVNNTALRYYHWLRNRNNRTRDAVINSLVLLLTERLRALPISDNPGRDAVNQMLEAFTEDARLVYNREDEFISAMGPVDNSYFYREMENAYDRIEHLYNRRSGGRGETGRGGSGDIESTSSAEGFVGSDSGITFPRITSGRLPRWEMLRYRRSVNPRDRTPTGDNDDNDATGSTEVEATFGVLQPRRNISSRNVRRDSEDARSEMENLQRIRARERMRREIAGDIIFPERSWHGVAPPYATTIQRYARGMNARNTN